MTHEEMYLIHRLVHRVDSYEDLPERFQGESRRSRENSRTDDVGIKVLLFFLFASTKPKKNS
jgi:hypothetical protein